MREILFRGKRLDNGEWLEAGTLLQNSDNERLCWMPVYGDKFGTVEDNDGNILRMEYGTLYKVDPATVGQYTGLQDKNGKRVFEGDICHNTKTGEIVSVKWHGTMAGFVWNKRKENSHLSDFGELFRVYDKYEVIGNIHDNPELMDGGAENAD